MSSEASFASSSPRASSHHSSLEHMIPAPSAPTQHLLENYTSRTAQAPESLVTASNTPTYRDPRSAQMSPSLVQLDIPNLLGSNSLASPADVKFELRLRQQPMAARSCGFGERDRRHIDPPPIVELWIEGDKLSEDDKKRYLHYDKYVMSCSVVGETEESDATYIPEFPQHRRLMGSLVTPGCVAKDEHRVEGCFFPFSDLSCRTAGSFRLKFSLIMMNKGRDGFGKHSPIVKELVSDVFHVYSAKDFPGMQPSSELAKALKRQGCLISIKKGTDRQGNARDGEDDDMD